MTDSKDEIERTLIINNVVELRDLRIARARHNPLRNKCRHRSLAFNDLERRIHCDDCGETVEAYDAFKTLCNSWEEATRKLKRREEAVKKSEAHSIRSRAAKVMDDEWRRRSTVPLCPHCTEALLPEDIVKGLASAGKSLIVARRKRNQEKSS